MADLENVGEVRSAALKIAVPKTPHIADVLIAERGEKIVNSRWWPLIRPILYKILHYDEAVRMADELAPLPGDAAMDYVSRLLSIDIDVTGLERIPASGRLHRCRESSDRHRRRRRRLRCVEAGPPRHLDLRQPRCASHQSAPLGIPDPGRMARGFPRPREDAGDAAALLARLSGRARRRHLRVRPHRLLEGRQAQRTAVDELRHHAGAETEFADPAGQCAVAKFRPVLLVRQLEHRASRHDGVPRAPEQARQDISHQRSARSFRRSASRTATPERSRRGCRSMWWSGWRPILTRNSETFIRRRRHCRA